MNVTITQTEGVDVVHVHEPRLVYALLPTFTEALSPLVARNGPKIVIDLSGVSYIDSATIGCLMDLYRQTTQTEGMVKLAGVQTRVKTMLTMTGAQNFIELHDDESSAVESFRE